MQVGYFLEGNNGLKEHSIAFRNQISGGEMGLVSASPLLERHAQNKDSIVPSNSSTSSNANRTVRHWEHKIRGRVQNQMIAR